MKTLLLILISISAFAVEPAKTNDDACFKLLENAKGPKFKNEILQKACAKVQVLEA